MTDIIRMFKCLYGVGTTTICVAILAIANPAMANTEWIQANEEATGAVSEHASIHGLGPLSEAISGVWHATFHPEALEQPMHSRNPLPPPGTAEYATK